MTTKLNSNLAGGCSHSRSSTGSWLVAIRNAHHANHHHKVAMQCLSKEVEELTDEERISICISAGVQTQYRNGRLETVFPVGIAKEGNRWNVFLSPNKDYGTEK